MIKATFFGDFVAKKSTDIILSDDIKSIISSSDIAVCNFEAPIDGGFEPFDREGPRVNQLASAPDLLINWGINVVQLANNHMLDYGEKACRATLDAFSNITTVGAGGFDEAYSIKVIQAKGIRIGLLSCVHHEFGVWESKNSFQKEGTAWICHNLIQSKIREAKDIVDFLIVLPHAGIEEIDAPIPEWRELYKSFIEWGADAVVGTHPHVPQGWEEYKGKPIFYSLGNFYFDALEGNHAFWKKSIALELYLDKNEISYKVVSICFNDGIITLDHNSDRVMHNQYLCDLLQDSNYINFCNDISCKLWNVYSNRIVRGLGAISFKLGLRNSIKTIVAVLFRKPSTSILLNTFQCESHRWIIERYLRNNNK